MDNERKKKLLNYLFPTDEAREFICNNLFYELSFIVKSTSCISYNNITIGVRKRQLDKVKNQIKDFLINNEIYLKKLFTFYNEKSVDCIVNYVVIGYVFYISISNRRYYSFDIFKDKRSICYEPISIIDML